MSSAAWELHYGKFRKKTNDRGKVVEELFRDEASGGADSVSELSWELSDNSEQMSEPTGRRAALSRENPDDSRSGLNQ